MKISFSDVGRSNTMLDYLSQLPLKMDSNKILYYDYSKMHIIRKRIITNMSGFVFNNANNLVIPYSYSHASLINNLYKFENIRFINVIKKKDSIDWTISTKMASSAILTENITFSLEVIRRVNGNANDTYINSLFTKLNPLAIINGRVPWKYLIELYKEKTKKQINEYDCFPYFFIDRYTECNKKYWLVKEKESNKSLILSEDTLKKEKNTFKNLLHETIY